MALVGFLCVGGWQLRLQIPLLILGQGLGHFLPTEALAGCREGILGRFLWKPEWLTRAREELSRQGSSAEDDSGVMGWLLPGWGFWSHTDVPVSLLWLFQAASGLPKSLSTSCQLCFGSVIAVGSPTCRTTPGEEVSCAQNHASTCDKGWAPLPLTHGGAGRDYRSQHAASCLPPPMPYLAGCRQGCCSWQQCWQLRGMARGGQGLSTRSPTADEALGEVLENPMLRSPDWKRTRQACGFSGVANPTLPKEGGVDRGGKVPSPGSLGCFSGAVCGGSWVGGDGGEKEQWALGTEQQCQGCPWLSKVTQERAVTAPGKWELEMGGLRGCGWKDC